MSQEKIDRGVRAEKLINDELFRESFDSMRMAIFERMEKLPLAEKDALHEYRLMLKLLHDVKINLESFIREGKVELFRLEETKARDKRTLFNWRR